LHNVCREIGYGSFTLATFVSETIDDSDTHRNVWVNEQQTKTSHADWVNVPALIANIFAETTYRTNKHNKIGDMCH
jgi:hypothetical protein